MVACARLKHVDQYLDKVTAMPADLAAMRISAADFRRFREMWSQLRLLSGEWVGGLVGPGCRGVGGARGWHTAGRWARVLLQLH